MLKPVVISKSEQKRLAIQMQANMKRNAKLAQSVSAPLIQPNPELPICVIIDIDGVLSERGDRAIFDFDKSIEDRPFFQVIYLLRLIDDANKYKNSLVPKTHIILLTGREEQYSAVTNKWLNRHQIPFDMLLMRRTADRRDSAIVKEEIYAGNIRGKYNVLFAIEDTQRNADKYRELGLYCFLADNSRD